MPIHIEKHTHITTHTPPDLTPFHLKSTFIKTHDAVENNLLLLFHGLGDTLAPFETLARNLKLPQTSYLLIQGPGRIPLLEEDAFEYYPSFDMLGELLPHPDPSQIVQTLSQVVNYLVTDLKWTPAQLHAFGYGQGASVALELAKVASLESVVSVEGELLSHPTTSSPKDTALLFITRRPPKASDKTLLERLFASVTLQHSPGRGMLRGREWEPVMVFFSERMVRLSELELGDDVYRVM